MRTRLFITIAASVIFAALWTAAGTSCYAQYREYYIFGKVLDSDNKPLADVEISLRDSSTSRSYDFKTNKKGKYKFVGLPHGRYKVTVKKEGYKTMDTEWDFSLPQDRMQKVEVDTIVMMSRARVEEVEMNKALRKEFELAREKIQKGDIDGALQALEKVLAKKPDETNSLYLKGVCLISKQKFLEAIESFTKVTQLTPKFAGAHYQMGICYQKQKQFEKALAGYARALELEPGNFVSIFNSALINYELKKYTEALTFFEKALKQKKDDAEILELMGLSYIHKEDYPKALEYLEKAQTMYTNAGNNAKVSELQELVKGLKEQVKK